MQTMKNPSNRSGGSRVEKLRQIRDLYEWAAVEFSEFPEEFKEAVDAVRDGDMCVFQFTEEPSNAYSIAAQLRKKLIESDEFNEAQWKVVSTKLDEGGGVVLVEYLP